MAAQSPIAPPPSDTLLSDYAFEDSPVFHAALVSRAAAIRQRLQPRAPKLQSHF